MGALTKSLRHSEAVADSAHKNAIQLKAAGMLDLGVSSSSGLSQWTDNARYRERYNLFRGIVYAAINAIALEAASQPVNLSRIKGTVKQKSRSGTKHLTNRMLPAAAAKAVDSDLEIVKHHEFLDILEVPNPVQNRWQLVYSFTANLLLTGWGYIVGGETKDGFELYSLPTTWIKPDHSKGPFTGFRIVNPKKPEDAGEGKLLGRENVAFAHLPNPSDPLAAMAPAGSQMQAIRVDDHIWTSREVFFDNGIFPSVIVTVGKDPHPGAEGGGVRPRLTAGQRRQVNSVIRKTMAGIHNYGNPAIIDGYIESIDKLSMGQNEMGWEKSEASTKQAILTAFGVHPYILGEAVGVGGYAQVANIEKRFYERVNCYLDMLGQVMTNFVGNAEQNDKLVVWWEKKEVRDPSLHAANLFKMRSNDDISQDEIRAEFGFGPDEDRNQSVLGKNAAQVMKTLELLGAGTITEKQAVAVFESMGLPTDVAEEMAKPPEKKEEPAPAPMIPGQPPIPGQEGAVPAAKPKPGKKSPTKEEAVEEAAKALEQAVSYLRISPKRLARQFVDESKLK